MSEPREAKVAQLELTLACREAFLDYKKSSKDGKLKLMLAAGNNGFDGWFCTDIFPNHSNNVYYCNMAEPFCFDSDSFDYIHCEHGIEHIEFEDALKCLSECYRVLKKGGVLRIATPSLEKWIHYYTENSEYHNKISVIATHTWLETAMQCGIYSKCLVFNNAMRNWGHKLLYDFGTLSTILSELKFENVISVEIDKSEHPELVDMERHFKNSPMKDYNDRETMVLEARK